MLISHNEKYLISNMGWVDKGALWILNTETHKTETVTFRDAQYCAAYTADHAVISVLQICAPNKIVISIHSFDEVSSILARVIVTDGVSRFEGDHLLWQQVPDLYISYLKQSDSAGYCILQVNANEKKVDIIKMPWFDDNYDQAYQSPIGITRIKSSNQVLVNIQKCSELVLLDDKRFNFVKNIPLMGRNGNPEVYVRKKSNEIWVTDYDALMCLSADTFAIKNNVLLQTATEGSQLFIGKFSFDIFEKQCAVARPYSSDVVIIEPKDMKVVKTISMVGEPLDVALLSDGRVFARDWKSGRLLSRSAIS